MDVIVLFMKLEDKYWGIFLAALFFLYVLWIGHREKQKAKTWTLFLAVYGLVCYLLFLCPLTYRAVQRFVPALSGYYELSHIQLMVPIIVLAATAALLLANKEGRKRAVYLLIGFTLLLMAAGNFAYITPEPSGWGAICSKEEAKAFDMVLTHAKENGDDGKIRIWGMDKLMAKSRLYDASFQPVYGKDMADNPGKYSEALQSMYQSYTSYDTQSGTAINIGDQLDAIASLPHLYPEADCEYVILYDPEHQFADYAEFFGERGFDAIGRVSALGYEPVGRTEHLLLFYRQEG